MAHNELGALEGLEYDPDTDEWTNQSISTQNHAVPSLLYYPPMEPNGPVNVSAVSHETNAAARNAETGSYGLSRELSSSQFGLPTDSQQARLRQPSDSLLSQAVESVKSVGSVCKVEPLRLDQQASSSNTQRLSPSTSSSLTVRPSNHSDEVDQTLQHQSFNSSQQPPVPSQRSHDSSLPNSSQRHRPVPRPRRFTQAAPVNSSFGSRSTTVPQSVNELSSDSRILHQQQQPPEVRTSLAHQSTASSRTIGPNHSISATEEVQSMPRRGPPPSDRRGASIAASRREHERPENSQRRSNSSQSLTLETVGSRTAERVKNTREEIAARPQATRPDPQANDDARRRPPPANTAADRLANGEHISSSSSPSLNFDMLETNAREEVAARADPQVNDDTRRNPPAADIFDARPKTTPRLREAHQGAENVGPLRSDVRTPLTRGGVEAISREEEKKAVSKSRLLIQRGKLKQKNNKHAESVEFFKRALDSVTSVLGKDHPEVGDTHYSIGGIYCKADHDKEAVEELLKALEIYKKNGYSITDNANKLWRVHDALGQAYSSLSFEEKSIEQYETAIEVLVQSTPNPPERLQHMRNNLGNAYKVTGRLDKAREILELARDEMLKSHASSEEMAKIHSSLGDVYMEMGRSHLAVEELEKCIEIREQLNSGPEGVLKRTLIAKKLAKLYEVTGNKQKSQEQSDKLKEDLAAFMNSKDKRDELLSDTSVSEERASLLYKLGCILLKIENRSSTEEAVEVHKKCLSMYEKLADTPDHRRHRARVYRGLGQGYNELKNYRKSIEAYMCAKELLVELDDADELRAICNNVGNAYEELSEFSKAEENIKQAISITEKLAVDNPDPKLQIDIAASYNNLGVMYQSWEKYDKSIQYLQRSLTMRQSLKNDSRTAAKDEASSHHNLGNTYRLMDRIKESLKHYEMELKIRKDLSSDTTRVRVALSQLYEEMGDVAKAEELLEDA
ncbi:tetratricopeptide repeat protein 28-like [Watersipora subatra]|uniref:tetratricopeptide repeat protein 28-like n=1 Tax=Watersipora subatra TaxID=2589382 RepID=UPI00355C28C7